jgi:hypothetical protein
MDQKEFKKGDRCVYFGRMIRYRNNTMRPSNEQKMIADLGNTMAESRMTKIMRRGELC